MINEKLKTLIVLDRVKSYTQTAKLCNISQPAVTQHIQSLEKEFNIEIFKRYGKKLITTPAGKILIKNAKILFAINNNIRKELTESLTDYKKLDIGITLTASDYLIPEILNVFKIKYPKIHFNFHTHRVETILEKLKHYELDFAIIEGIKTYPKFTTKLLAKDELILITATNHPFTKLSQVTWDMIKKEKLILRHKEANTRILLENYLNSQKDSLSNYEIILEVDNTSLIRHLVRDGHGISIMPRSICRNDLNLNLLKEVKVKDFTLVRGVYLIHHKDFDDDKLVQDIASLKDSQDIIRF